MAIEYTLLNDACPGSCGGKLFDSEFDYVAYISKASVEYMIDTAEVTKFTWFFALIFYLGERHMG